MRNGKITNITRYINLLKRVRMVGSVPCDKTEGACTRPAIRSRSTKFATNRDLSHGENMRTDSCKNVRVYFSGPYSHIFSFDQI